MNKNEILWIKINTKSYYNLLLKLNNIGITMLDNKKLKDSILIKTTASDYKKIKKYLISYQITIYSKTGFLKLKELINKYIVFLISIVFGIIILICANNLILKVDIKTSNKNIQSLLKEELEKYNLGIMRFKKNHKKVESIVDNILNDNKDILEWLEIRYNGLIMIVNVTEKSKTEVKNSYNNCNIIAKTDAKISSLNIYKGVPLKEINDYVIKGDVILSGSIIHNEEIKNTVCANGEIYGEVWYKVKVEIPFKENYIKYTGKERYNLNIKMSDNKYQLLRSRIKNKKEDEIKIYKLNDFEINLIKEKEYITETKVLSEEEAYNKGINTALEKVKIKLSNTEEILHKKVLKKEVNDSTIYLEIFIVTKENIGELQVISEEFNYDVNSSTKSY